jgi:aquaglyceroporin related protein
MSDDKPLALPPSPASLPSPQASHEENAKHLDLLKPEGSGSGTQTPYEEHGPGIDHKIPQEDVVQAEPQLWWSKTRHMLREPFSEFFGVFILILFGDGHVNQS